MGRWLIVWTLAACASPIDHDLAQPVTAGTADVGDLAVMGLVDSADQVGCTASVIGPHTAITAAHCLLDHDPRELRGFFGASLDGGGAFIAISDGRTHPSFDPDTLAHDVALLTLREEAPVAPLALAAGPLDASLVRTSLRVVGFGTTAVGVA